MGSVRHHLRRSPHLTRILLPRNWTGHPLRKDYPARATEFDPFMLDAAKQDAGAGSPALQARRVGHEAKVPNEDYMFLNLGPNHPSAHGAFRIVLQLDGEEIVDCVPDIGYHHRGAEKMAERQTWHSYIPYTDRIDYLGGVMNNLPYVLAVEKLAGIEVPDRVKTIRVMMAEFFRITSHLLFLGTYIQDVGGMTPIFFMFTDRQKAYDVIEAITGFRMHPAWFRIGGVAHDLPQGWDRLVRDFVNWLPKRLDEYEKAAMRNGILRARTIDVAQYNAKEALEWGSPAPACVPPASTMTCARRAPIPATRTSTSKCRWPITGMPTTAPWFVSRRCARVSASSSSAWKTCRRARTRQIIR
jgi:NADH-quinone oxidoreductase subunit C/D